MYMHPTLQQRAVMYHPLQLLDDVTCLKLNVLLVRLETSAEYVAKCLRYNDDKEFDVGAKSQLLQALPSQEQVLKFFC